MYLDSHRKPNCLRNWNYTDNWRLSIRFLAEEAPVTAPGARGRPPPPPAAPPPGPSGRGEAAVQEALRRRRRRRRRPQEQAGLH